MFFVTCICLKNSSLVQMTASFFFDLLTSNVGSKKEKSKTKIIIVILFVVFLSMVIASIFMGDN